MTQNHTEMKKMDHSKTKVCTKCKVDKPLTEYHKNSCTKDGRACACKDCLNPGLNERSRIRRQESKMWSPI